MEITIILLLISNLLLILLLLSKLRRNRPEEPSALTNIPPPITPLDSQPEPAVPPPEQVHPREIVASITSSQPNRYPKNKYELAELQIDAALKKLPPDTCVVFHDLYLPTGRKIKRVTQIDNLVVSIYGIFCIETKSQRGNIYGYSEQKKWVQYLGGKKYIHYNPYRQNWAHIKSLEYFLGSIIRVPIHSYVTYPNAKKVMVDKEYVDVSIEGIIKSIVNHTLPIYSPQDVVSISKRLAWVSSKRDELAKIHREEMKNWVS